MGAADANVMPMLQTCACAYRMEVTVASAWYLSVPPHDSSSVGQLGDKSHTRCAHQERRYA
jgi:hypothetical protein